MSIDQQIAANEKTFQEWFQRSWDAHHKESPSATDFKDVGDPRPTMRQKSYDYLDKRTVRVMADLQSRPDDFVQLLQDYLINNALLLYQDSIRIANLPGSVSFYKDCGNQVGMVECHLSREGQIVTVAVGYQIYKKSIELRNDPEKFTTTGVSSQRDTVVAEFIYKSNNWLKIYLFNWGYYPFRFLITGTISILIGLFLVKTHLGALVLVGVLFYLIGLGSLFLLLAGLLDLIVNLNVSWQDRDVAKSRAALHVAHDLSHTFFPVAYYSKGKVTAALSENKDHAAFLERIRSVIDRAVAFGESSHNQRT